MANFLLSAGEAIKKTISPKELRYTSTAFSLFSHISVAICIFASILVMTSQNIGKPIECAFGSSASALSSDLINGHCWIYGTYHIDEKVQDEFPCRARKGNDHTAHTYYQWVVYMLVISALLFKIPHFIWKFSEKGIMKSFFSGKHQRSLFQNEADESTNLKLNLNRFKKLKGENGTYYYIFQFCQLLNVVMLILNWVITDKFIGGNFHTYGTDVISYYSMDEYEQQNSGDTFDPMCNAFPTTTSCTIKLGDPSGVISPKNGMCLLSQNIINEKIYLFLWFWFVFMFVVGGAQIVFEVAMFAIPSFRSFMFTRHAGSFRNWHMKRYIERCQHGDWFLLYQIGKNTKREFFYDLIYELTEEESRQEAETANAPQDNGELMQLNDVTTQA